MFNKPQPTPVPESAVPIPQIEAKPLEGLGARLQKVLTGHSFAEIARRTKVSAESARRYWHGNPPTVEFLAAVCQEYGVSADWLLCGVGAAHRSDVVAHLIAEATASQLCAAIDGKIELAKRIIAEASAAATLHEPQLE